MFEQLTHTESGERGQVGIGTLIVFIALVLVAAIAAGVLINTAGFLQSQAEQTGQESTDQVANNLQIQSAFGEVSSSGSEVTDPTLVISLAPGSGDINLDNVEVQVFLDNAATVSGQIDGATLSGDQVLSEGGTRTIDLEANTAIADTALTLSAGDEAEVVLITDDGSQVEVLASAPNPIVESDGTDIRLY